MGTHQLKGKPHTQRTMHEGTTTIISHLRIRYTIIFFRKIEIVLLYKNYMKTKHYIK